MTNAVNIAQSGSNNQTMRNRIINGAMTIDQRNAGASVTPTSLTYTVDRWAAVEQTDGSMTVQQSSTAPAGFTNSLLVTVTSADSSLGATQYAVLRQAIEGLNVADFAWGTANAQPVTVSFWVRSSVTGTFGGAMQNAAQDRSYPFSYTISAANTFEYKTVTIPGDTSGTWLTTNGVGFQLWFSFASGSTYSGTANAWAGSLFFAPTGATNLMATNGATWYITGVQLEEGTAASPFEYRLYGTELDLCQRYYQAWYPAEQELIYNESGSADGKFWQLYMPVQMRTAPTSTYSSGMLGGNVIGLPGTISSLSLSSASRNRISSRVTMSAGGGSANLIYHCDSIGSGDFVGLNSEL
jgi:hypothetical protein